MPMTPMPPAVLPTDPRPVFLGKAFATVAAQSTFVTEANALEANVTALEAGAQDHADDAAAAQVAAEAAAAQSAFSAGVVKWVSGTTYAEGVQAWSPINKVTYRRIIPGAGTTDPSLDTTNWAPVWASIRLARDLGRARALDCVSGATVQAGAKYAADTSAAAITSYLPAIADTERGDRVEWVNVLMAWGKPYAFVIDRHEAGIYIQGAPASFNIDLPLPSLALECTYKSSTQAWWALAS